MFRRYVGLQREVELAESPGFTPMAEDGAEFHGAIPVHVRPQRFVCLILIEV